MYGTCTFFFPTCSDQIQINLPYQSHGPDPRHRMRCGKGLALVDIWVFPFASTDARLTSNDSNMCFNVKGKTRIPTSYPSTNFLPARSLSAASGRNISDFFLYFNELVYYFKIPVHEVYLKRQVISRIHQMLITLTKYLFHFQPIHLQPAGGKSGTAQWFSRGDDDLH